MKHQLREQKISGLSTKSVIVQQSPKNSFVSYKNLPSLDLSEKPVEKSVKLKEIKSYSQTPTHFPKIMTTRSYQPDFVVPSRSGYY